MRAYEEVLKRQARPFAATMALASLHLRAGATRKAATYAQQGLALQPGNPMARAMMVRVDLARKNTPKAAEELAALHKEFPNVPDVLNLVAQQQFADGKISAARASYTRAAELSSNNVEAISGLVRMDVAAGHPKDAVGRIEAALKRMSPTVDLLVLAGRTCAAAGIPDQAAEFFKRAIDVDPVRLVGHSALGELYLGQKRLEGHASSCWLRSRWTIGDCPSDH